MPEYIEREALIEFIKQNTPNINGETTIECVERAIRTHPAADVVEVVRCRDCIKHYKDGFCDVFDVRTKAKDYCSYGERRCENG